MNKKAQRGISGLGDILIGAIIVIAIVIGFVGTVLAGFNEFSEEDACSDASCSFDNPAGFCAINSSSEGSGIACPNDVRQSLPLGILFSLVLGLVFAAAMFVVIRNAIMKQG